MIYRSGLVILLVLSGCTVDLGSSTDSVMVEDCEITGSGTHAAGDTGSGSVSVTDSVLGTGTWSHTTVGGDALSLSVTGGSCLINGETIGNVTGTIDDGSGDTFRVRISDRGDPSVPTTVPGTPGVETLVASRTYDPDSYADASLAIADLARVTLPAELPVTTGSAGSGTATVSFDLADGGSVTCEYAAVPSSCDDSGGHHHGHRGRGRGHHSHGHGHGHGHHDCHRGHGHHRGRGRGHHDHGRGHGRGHDRHGDDDCDCSGSSASYAFVACDGAGVALAPGDTVDVSALSIHVASGDSGEPSGSPETAVTVDLDVTPLTVTTSELDDYTFSRLYEDPVWGPVELWREAGTIVVGDFTVRRP